MFIVLQAVTFPVVIGIFHLVSVRAFAALVAGSWFCLTTLYMVLRSRAWGRPRHLLFWVFLFFLSFISLPLVFVRAFYFDIPMDKLRIWWVPAPIFHGISNLFYFAMFGTTIFFYLGSHKKIRGHKG